MTLPGSRSRDGLKGPEIYEPPDPSVQRSQSRLAQSVTKSRSSPWTPSTKILDSLRFPSLEKRRRASRVSVTGAPLRASRRCIQSSSRDPGRRHLENPSSLLIPGSRGGSTQRNSFCPQLLAHLCHHLPLGLASQSHSTRNLALNNRLISKFVFWKVL